MGTPWDDDFRKKQLYLPPGENIAYSKTKQSNTWPESEWEKMESKYDCSGVSYMNPPKIVPGCDICQFTAMVYDETSEIGCAKINLNGTGFHSDAQVEYVACRYAVPQDIKKLADHVHLRK